LYFTPSCKRQRDPELEEPTAACYWL